MRTILAAAVAAAIAIPSSGYAQSAGGGVGGVAVGGVVGGPSGAVIGASVGAIVGSSPPPQRTVANQQPNVVGQILPDSHTY